MDHESAKNAKKTKTLKIYIRNGEIKAITQALGKVDQSGKKLRLMMIRILMDWVHGERVPN